MAVVKQETSGGAGAASVEGLENLGNINLVDGVDEGFEDLVDGADVVDGECEGEEEIFVSSCGDASGSSFEQTMMELETIMMDEAFNKRVGAFLTSHCHEFDEGDENKLAYTKLFEEYTEMLETYIEQRLGESQPGFDMAAFCTQLLERKDSLDADLDTLGAFGDFEAFKDMMLACKLGKRIDEAGGGPLCVSGAQLQVHTDEQEDGEEMPDLNLSISAVSGH